MNKEFIYWGIEIALLLAMLRSRRWAMMIIAFSVPLSRRLPSFPVPLLNFQNLMLLFALLAFSGKTEEREHPALGRVRYGLPIVLLLLLFTISFINTQLTFVPKIFYRLWDPYNNVMQYKALVTVFLFYFLASVAVRTREDLIQIAQATMAGMLMEASYTAAEFLIFNPGRASGHLAEPNSLGAFLVTALPFFLAALLCIPRSDRRWKVSAVGAVSSAIGIVGTLSRGSMLGAVGGFLVMTSLKHRKVLVLGLLLLALKDVWLPDSVEARFSSTFVPETSETWRYKDGQAAEASELIAMINEELEESSMEGTDGKALTRLDGSIQARLLVWTTAMQIIPDYPFGVGFGVFPWYVQFYGTVIRFLATHNIYLKVATEAGILALVLFLFILSRFFKDAIALSRVEGDPEMRAFGMGALGAASALCLNAFFVDVFFQIEVNAQFWIMMGLLAQARAAYGEGKPPVAEEARPVTAAEPPAGPRPLYELVR